jgi:hypothetical protein
MATREELQQQVEDLLAIIQDAQDLLASAFEEDDEDGEGDPEA